jgi:hypothetical protein
VSLRSPICQAPKNRLQRTVMDNVPRQDHSHAAFRPRKGKRGVDLVSDVLPFGRLWYGEPSAIGNAIDYAVFQPLT